MKKIPLFLIFILLFSAGRFAAAGGPTAPAPVPQVDTDHDGFWDAEEMAGIRLADGTWIQTDPLIPDGFVIIERTDPSYLPANLFRDIEAREEDGGLGIEIHEVTYAQAPNSRVTTNQKAAVVRESQDLNGLDFGSALHGVTFNSANAIAFVFPGRAIVWLNDLYQENGEPFVPQDVLDNMIRRTVQHELGHIMGLSSVYNFQYGGYHYSSNAKVMMSQSVTWTSSQGQGLRLDIPTEWTDECRLRRRLR